MSKNFWVDNVWRSWWGCSVDVCDCVFVRGRVRYLITHLWHTIMTPSSDKQCGRSRARSKHSLLLKGETGKEGGRWRTLWFSNQFKYLLTTDYIYYEYRVGVFGCVRLAERCLKAKSETLKDENTGRTEGCKMEEKTDKMMEGWSHYYH